MPRISSSPKNHDHRPPVRIPSRQFSNNSKSNHRISSKSYNNRRHSFSPDHYSGSYYDANESILHHSNPSFHPPSRIPSRQSMSLSRSNSQSSQMASTSFSRSNSGVSVETVPVGRGLGRRSPSLERTKRKSPSHQAQVEYRFEIPWFSVYYFIEIILTFWDSKWVFISYYQTYFFKLSLIISWRLPQ